MSTVKDLYKKISDSNRIKYGTEAERILRIIINQYSDRTHFIYEILQNAEDAGAKYIRFHLEKYQLLIFHNGRPFNERDIDGVCGIADGTKEDGTRIGHFGIGFKSVYCYTERPQIYSGKYCFEIHNQLFPKEISSRPGLSKEETCMILPFNKEDVLPETAYQEIKTALTRKITAESILMLNNISDIEIKSIGYDNIIEISKEKYPIDKAAFVKNVFSLSMRTTVTNTRTRKQEVKDNDYLYFTDANQEATAIIFKVDGKELTPVRNSKIYAYFPTAKEAHQNFYIHAPFDTTPARDNFKEGAEYGKHNIELVKAIGQLIWFALKWMKEHQYLSVRGFNTVFPVYEYEEDDVLYGIYQNSIEIIREEEILPTSKPGVFKNIKDVCVPLWGVIVDVFDEEDLRKLTRRRNLSWLAKEVSTEAFSEFRSFLNRHFNVETLDWKDLVQKMDAGFLRQKSISWMEKLLPRIESYCIKKDSRDSHYINSDAIPLVRTKDGEQICARDPEGKLLVYLNNPETATYIIDSSFLKKEVIRSFYERALRIPEYNVVREVIDNILPKYQTETPFFKTNNAFKENIDDLKTVKNALISNATIVDRIKDSYIVTDGKAWFKPTDIYIDSTDIRKGYSLVKGVLPLRFLADAYTNGAFGSLNLDDDFFKKIGCNNGLRLVSCSTEEYLEAVRYYQGYKTAADIKVNIFDKKNHSASIKWNQNYEGFPDVFSNMNKKKSLSIGRFLNANSTFFDINGEIVGSDNKQYTGDKVQSRTVYSMLGLQLSFEKWIYVRNDPEPHSPLEVEKKDILADYSVLTRLLSILPFKEPDNAFNEWVDSNFKNVNDAALVKKFGKDPEKLLALLTAAAKSEARAGAKAGKKQSIKELLKKGDKAQSTPGSVSNNPDVNPISEKGIKKRTQNLDDQLAQSLDNFTRVTKGVYFGSRESNKEERMFLEQEYEGRCQICYKQIIKHNGEHYFEAINIFRFNDMPDQLKASSRYGWNSLCLCPNCAAEYIYCSKKIGTLYDQVVALDVVPDSDEPIAINIEIPQGKKRTIKYSPRHFLALKEALKLFSDIT